MFKIYNLMNNRLSKDSMLHINILQSLIHIYCSYIIATRSSLPLNPSPLLSPTYYLLFPNNNFTRFWRSFCKTQTLFLSKSQSSAPSSQGPGPPCVSFLPFSWTSFSLSHHAHTDIAPRRKRRTVALFDHVVGTESLRTLRRTEWRWPILAIAMHLWFLWRTKFLQ